MVLVGLIEATLGVGSGWEINPHVVKLVKAAVEKRERDTPLDTGVGTNKYKYKAALKQVLHGSTNSWHPCDLETIDGSDMSLATFETLYRGKNAFRIRDGMAGWGALHQVIHSHALAFPPHLSTFYDCSLVTCVYTTSLTHRNLFRDVFRIPCFRRPVSKLFARVWRGSAFVLPNISGPTKKPCLQLATKGMTQP